MATLHLLNQIATKNAMDTDEITITIGKDEGMKHNSARSLRQEQGDCSIALQGLAGKSKVTKMVTWSFAMKDEGGMMNKIMIPNTQYAQMLH